MKKGDANHWEKGDHSGARFDLCTVYGHIHQQLDYNLMPLVVGFLLFNIGVQPKVDGFHTNVYTMAKPQGHIERKNQLPHQLLQK